jgi:hypothetical protein
MRPGHEADRSIRSSGQNKNVWSYNFTPPFSFLARCLSKHGDSFTSNFLYSDNGLIFSRPPKLSLCDPHAVYVPMYPPFQLSNASTNRYEIWYVYHGVWAYLNGVLHKSFPSVCVSVCVSLLSLLGNGSVNTFPRQQIHATVEELLDARVCGSLPI